ncbi:hypothetical protein PILCRDRAFT_830414, partial [Piloderma croceum F 1598]
TTSVKFPNASYETTSLGYPKGWFLCGKSKLRRRKLSWRVCGRPGMSGKFNRCSFPVMLDLPILFPSGIQPQRACLSLRTVLTTGWIFLS